LLLNDAEICKKKQRQQDIQDTIELIDEWQNMSEVCQEKIKDRLKQSESKYREMLLSNQIDIQTYIYLTQLISYYVNLNHNHPHHQTGNNNLPVT
ncbi:hypothetical protein, partial [Hydrocoleum sp. CS-953]|uniref:hypothetical protein n=1 Tax=Hydrocoleum sp. CS-953 TaxID=1671698 RepID=UPI001AEF41A1